MSKSGEDYRRIQLSVEFHRLKESVVYLRHQMYEIGCRQHSANIRNRTEEGRKALERMEEVKDDIFNKDSTTPGPYDVSFKDMDFTEYSDE